MPKLVCYSPDDDGGISIDAHVTRTSRGLGLNYRVEGAVETLAVPEPVAASRADGLWQTTCFELFLRQAGSTSYIEANYSPSGRWATYLFSSYREGIRALDMVVAPKIRLFRSRFLLTLGVDMGLPPQWRAQDAAVGLSAVIEDGSGRIRYWALAHPQAKADFHHPDCFTVRLAAPDCA